MANPAGYNTPIVKKNDGTMEVHSTLDIKTATGGALHVDGVDVSAGLQEIVDLSGLSSTELGYLNGAVAGTATASKAVVLNAAGSQGVIKGTALHIGTSGSETQVTATGAELNYVDVTTIGIAQASKAAVLDANKHLDEVNTASLKLGASGSTVAVTATAAQLNKTVDGGMDNAAMSPFQGPPQHFTFEYDFAALGGAAGVVTLTLPSAGGALTIPDNFVITNAWLEGITVGASGGGAAGTMKLGITGNDDCFVAATAEDDAMFTADAITALTNEVPLKTSAAVSVIGTIATDDWTQGKFRVHVMGFEGA